MALKITYQQNKQSRLLTLPLRHFVDGIKEIRLELLEAMPTNAGIINKTYFLFVMSKKILEKRQKSFMLGFRQGDKKEDLDRQIEFLRSHFPTHQLVTDIGSGINFKRRGLQTILERASKRELSQVVVAHRDRLSRIAFDLIQSILDINKVQLFVLDNSHHESPEQELAEDITSFVHVYSCKQMGRRRYSKSNDSIVSYQATNDNIQKVDG